MATGHSEVGRRRFGGKLLKFGVIALVTGFVFMLGMGVGNGSITFQGDKVGRSSQLPTNLDFSSVEEVYDLLRNRYDGNLEQAKLIEGLKKGLVEAAGDPYTEFMSAEQTKEFDEDLNGTFSGIGAELSKDGDAIVVVSPISGFPAEKAGLKSKDVIVEIDGTSTYGMSVSEAVKRIRGEKGTQVKLRVIRGGSEDLSFDITRDNITIPSVESKMLEGNIGYIKISRFSDDTTQLTREAATQLKQQGAKGVVLDLRGNPGGLLDAAVGVSSVWLPAQKTVLEEKRDGVVIKTYYASGSPILEGIPTVVLINDGSASASEITAGALKDNGAATLLGEKSYGKGSVQQIERLKDGSALKVTIARWFTPNGRNIDKEGIEPDTKVEQKSDSSEDQQLNQALAELKK